MAWLPTLSWTKGLRSKMDDGLAAKVKLDIGIDIDNG